MSRVLFALAIVACGQRDEPAADQPPPPVIAEAEIQRGLDACKAYVEQVCACTTDAAKEPCKLAKVLPGTIEVARRLATNPTAAPDDARQAAGNIRKTVKHCIEQTARLPELGC